MTLTEIRAKVRRLTGRLSTGQLSNADLDVYINRFYQEVLPTELSAPQFKGWWTQNTAAGTDEYEVDDDYLALQSPFTIAGNQYVLRQNPVEFYLAWPETETYDQSEPYDALLDGRTVILRPPPDDVYEVKARAIVRPAELSEVTDEPLDSAWGIMIAHGAAIDILLDDGDIQAASEYSQALTALIANAYTPICYQLGTQRSVPGF